MKSSGEVKLFTSILVVALVLVGFAVYPTIVHPGRRPTDIPKVHVEPKVTRKALLTPDTRIRGDGRGGTGLPDTISASAISVTEPSSARTVVVGGCQVSMTPSRSVIAGPPLGPVRPGSTRRTTTRCRVRAARS